MYFAGVMVRLMLTLTPCVCMLAAIGFSTTLDKYLVDVEELPTQTKPETKKKKKESGSKKDVTRSFLFIFLCLFARNDDAGRPGVADGIMLELL